MRSPSLRTRAIVLEILAGICLVPGGHKRIMESTIQFAKLIGEHARFQTVVHCLEADVLFRGGYEKFERIVELQVLLKRSKWVSNSHRWPRYRSSTL